MPRHDRHFLQGIIELRSAITADLIASAPNGENSTQIRMMTSECKIQTLKQRMDEPIPTGKFFTYRHAVHLVLTAFRSSMRISVEAVRNFTPSRDRGHNPSASGGRLSIRLGPSHR